MNKREKILVTLVGCLALLFVGRWATVKYGEMLTARKSEYRNLEQKLAKVELQKLDARHAADRWMELGAQTLSMDPDDAKRRFRDELTDQVKNFGMANGAVNMSGSTTSWLRSGIRVMSGTVSAEGDLSKIVAFLFQVYRQPFVVRIRSLMLTQAGTKGQKGLLKMTATAEIPILPSNAIVPRIIPAESTKGTGASKPKEVLGRTAMASVDGYRPIWEKKIFEPYVPPVPPPGKPANPNPRDNMNAYPTVALSWPPVQHATSYKVFWGTKGAGDLVNTQPNTRWMPPSLAIGTKYVWHVEAINESGTTVGDTWTFTVIPLPSVQTRPAEPKNPDIVMPPPDPCTDCNLVVARVLSSPATQQVVLVDPAQANNPAATEKRVEVGDQLFGGTLILVHPKGAVTQIETSGHRYFHAMGQAGSARQPLSEKDQPEVFDEVGQLEQRAKGISQLPG